jgi:hypothetical protein
MRLRTILAMAVTLPLALDAGTIGFLPTGTYVPAVGSSAQINVFASGFGKKVAPSLSAFDLEVAFDPALVSLDPSSVVIDPFNQLNFDGFALTGFDAPSPGVLHIFEVSIDTSDSLNTLQDGNFLLARFELTMIAEGISPLHFQNVVLGDAYGQEISAQLVDGSIQTPEPTSFSLMCFGLAGLVFAQSARRRRI